MNACGLIVEYNPFHNGHLYHVQQAKEISEANCMIAVMSGSFLQRGEPAIIDKFHRTKAALASGVDIVLELPYPFAVQSSDLFAKGAVQTLHEIGVDTICFGSESGTIDNFTTSYKMLKENETLYNDKLKWYLKKGCSFPNASKMAYQEIGFANDGVDLSKPNNILGFSYVRNIFDNKLPINPLTIKRTKNNYHDPIITSSIASATSIRNSLLATNNSMDIAAAMPDESIDQLKLYKQKATIWHTLEQYFDIVHYRVMTMSLDELSMIQGVDEGIEHRIKKTANNAVSFNKWIEAIKTKRYTWTRLQRMFIHILTNTKKSDMKIIGQLKTVPYVRLLGLTNNGKVYLNKKKKDMDVPIISALNRNMNPILSMEERATHAYYSILPPKIKNELFKQELLPPIFL